MAIRSVQDVFRTLVSVAIIILLAILYGASKMKLKVQRFQNEIVKQKLLPKDFDVQSYIKGVSRKHNFTEEDLVRGFNVRSDGSDVIVYLRVQKTGSSNLARHLTENIDLRPTCNCSKKGIKRCYCLKKWAYNVLLRPTFHDGTCGMHAGYAQLLPCVDRELDKRQKRHRKRRRLYITNLRDPLRRYLSEWRHVKLHGQWTTSPKDCQHPTTGKAWTNVTLQQFIKCKTNPAINRQTRLLGLKRPLYQQKLRKITDMELIKSAKDNLKHFAFFGITAYQELSQIMFENTFNLSFNKGFETLPQKAENIMNYITEEQRREIVEMNWLDGMFFEYAEDLFRLRILKLIERTQNVTLRERLAVLSQPLFKNI